ncbi:MAG: cyclodeaminase/cyclohydrolase family protein [Acidimicrobiales bacterium]
MSEPGTGGAGGGFSSMPLDDLLEAFSSADPAPGGGGAAVIAVALSASLCAMAARLSARHMPGAQEIITVALSLRDGLAPLCEQDAEAYSRVIAAHRLPGGPDPDERRRRVVEALSHANAVPLATMKAAAALAPLAARLAEEGNPNLRGDAVVAAVLAGAGAEACAALVRTNLVDLPQDDRHVEVRSLLKETLVSVERARRAGEAGS